MKTGIICTLGPASGDFLTLKKMMLAGMDVARLNLSHGSFEEHQGRIDRIRKLNRKYHGRLKILLDLEGPRIRIGDFKGKKSRDLKKGQTVFLSNSEKNSKKGAIPFDYDGSLLDIKKGSFVFIDDGYIALKVTSSQKNYIKAEVITPGVVKERKGVNIAGSKLKFKDPTDRDREGILFGLKNKVDFIAQSFVRSHEDIDAVKDIISKGKAKPRVIAKIESHEGIKHIDEIIRVSDGIMVARGDLGVCMPIFEVPILQKMIIKKCIQRKRFVITATQMLESMTEHTRPTRAEVSDVANAILDGSDYVMLSGETSVGSYPVATVRMMQQIIDFTEPFSKKHKGRKHKRLAQI